MSRSSYRGVRIPLVELVHAQLRDQAEAFVRDEGFTSTEEYEASTADPKVFAIEIILSEDGRDFLFPRYQALALTRGEEIAIVNKGVVRDARKSLGPALPKVTSSKQWVIS